MNINGIARSYMARHQGGEEFIKHVADLMERQLKEWNEDYQVFLMKYSYYELSIKNNERYYYVQLSEMELEMLKKKDPYALDRKLWKSLEEQGLPIQKGIGNYIDWVLS